MKNNYKLQNRGLTGRIGNIRKYFEEDHFYSSTYTAAALVCGGAGVFAIQEFINELNGLVPMDPESPMIIPAIGLPIAAFGFLAGAIKKRLNEDRELREKYARQLELIELNKQRKEYEKARIENNRKSIMNFMLDGYDTDNENEADNHKTR